MAAEQTTHLPALLAAVDAVDDPHMEAVLRKCTGDQERAIMRALRAAYEAGQDAADQRSGKLMARIFGGFVGVTPGIDVEGTDDRTPHARLRDVVRMLSGAVRR